VLGRLAREVDLHEQIDPASRGGGGFVNPTEQIRRVDRVDEIEARGGLFRLVRLQMSDEMPAQRQAGCRVYFRQRFLQTVFAEIDLSRGGGFANRFGRECLGNGNQAYRRGIATRAFGRACNARADVSETLLDAGQMGGMGRRGLPSCLKFIS